jgi:DNA-binding NarL/FixJ family response regulator
VTKKKHPETTMKPRILVVDDSALWRHYLSAHLAASGRYEIAGELADGHGAVEAVQRLTPTLTLLDIGLPSRSGIQVAAEILAAYPEARIVFLSEHRSADIATAALATGAQGYVVKSHAGHELLTAIDAVVHGGRFMGKGVTGLHQTAPTVAAATSRGRHELKVSSSATALWDSLASSLERSLRAEAAVIVVAEPQNRDAVRRTLESRGVDMRRAVADGRYVALDAAATLATFMVDGRLDERSFWKSATELVTTSRKRSPRQQHVVACGEGAPILLRHGQAAAAVRLEQLWDELAKIHSVDILCGYSAPAPLHGDDRRAFQQICAVHSVVHGHGGHTD